jgi:hypothetical protein
MARPDFTPPQLRSHLDRSKGITPLVSADAEHTVEDLVVIKLKKNHIATIGGVHYDFKKGSRYRVTRDIRAILSNSTLDLLSDPSI